MIDYYSNGAAPLAPMQLRTTLLPKRPIDAGQRDKVVQPAMDLCARGRHKQFVGKWSGVVTEIDPDEPVLIDRVFKPATSTHQTFHFIVVSEKCKIAQRLGEVLGSGRPV